VSLLALNLALVELFFMTSREVMWIKIKRRLRSTPLRLTLRWLLPPPKVRRSEMLQPKILLRLNYNRSHICE